MRLENVVPEVRMERPLAFRNHAGSLNPVPFRLSSQAFCGMLEGRGGCVGGGGMGWEVPSTVVVGQAPSGLDGAGVGLE